MTTTNAKNAVNTKSAKSTELHHVLVLPRPDRAPDPADQGLPLQPADVGLLALRGFVGVVLAGYGAQKLFGMFGGAGVAGTGDYFGSVGFTPGRPLAVLAGLTELACGLALAVGLATPLAGAGIVAVTIGAFDVVRSASAAAFFPSMAGAGWELLLAVSAAALVLTGPGRFAVDRGLADRVRVAGRVGRQLATPRGRWLALGLGLAGGLLGVMYRVL